MTTDRVDCSTDGTPPITVMAQRTVTGLRTTAA